MADDRAQLADLVAEKILRNRTVPVKAAIVRVIPDREDAAPTVTLEVVTQAGQRMLATFADVPEGDQ